VTPTELLYEEILLGGLVGVGLKRLTAISSSISYNGYLKAGPEMSKR
jgi:hypothetical protein